jgi:hypothetical protein
MVGKILPTIGFIKVRSQFDRKMGVTLGNTKFGSHRLTMVIPEKACGFPHSRE